MHLSRSTVLILCTAAFAVWLVSGATAPAARSNAAAGAPVAVASLASATTTPASEPAPRRGLIDANNVFFGCAAGTAAGALVTALPPMVGWTFYAGALPAVVAMLATAGVGCSVGLFGGVIVSTFAWLFATIGGAWHAVFG